MDIQLSFLSAGGQSSKVNSSKKEWKLFIDGAARNNPGPAGAGVYIELDGEEKLASSVYLGEKTNNQAEYLALIAGLYQLGKLKKQPEAVTIVSDSLLLIKQMKDEYKVKDKTLRVLKMIAKELLAGFSSSFHHTLRINNKKADRLANIAIDKKSPVPKGLAALLAKYNIAV